MYYRWQGSTSTSSEHLVPRQEPALCEAPSVGPSRSATSIPIPQEQATTPASTEDVPSVEVVPLSQSPAPSYRSTDVESGRTSFAVWAQETAALYPNRPSRASSIVSTRTKFSTSTIQDDARSIDLSIGSFSFRINRDGSRVTTFNNRESIPPYSLLSIDDTIAEERSQQSQQSDLTAQGDDSTSSTPERRIEATGSTRNLQPPQSTTLDLESSVSSLHISDHLRPGLGLQRSISDQQKRNVRSTAFQPAREVRPGPRMSRNRSYSPSEQTVSSAKPPKQRRTLSQNDLLTQGKTVVQRNPPLRRNNGVRLPSLVTDSSDSRRSASVSPISRVDSMTSASTTSQFPRSAGPAFPGGRQTTDIPQSPTYIGKRATGTFPDPLHNSESDSNSTLGRSHRSTSSTSLEVGSSSHNQDERFETTPLRKVDSENEISNHYTRMIRFIDREHRRALHAKDRELAELRERINEMDTIYRQELRNRDFQIDDLQRRLGHLEDNTQVMIQRARHEVEDLWETWWKDRDFHLTERMRRIEKDAQSMVERAVAERDRLWRISWTKKYEMLIDRLKEIEGGQYDISGIDDYGSYAMAIEILSSMSGLPTL